MKNDDANVVSPSGTSAAEVEQDQSVSLSNSPVVEDQKPEAIKVADEEPKENTASLQNYFVRTLLPGGSLPSHTEVSNKN